jgi:hypothetical protein
MYKYDTSNETQESWFVLQTTVSWLNSSSGYRIRVKEGMNKAEIGGRHEWAGEWTRKGVNKWVSELAKANMTTM